MVSKPVIFPEQANRVSFIISSQSSPLVIVIFVMHHVIVAPSGFRLNGRSKPCHVIEAADWFGVVLDLRQRSMISEPHLFVVDLAVEIGDRFDWLISIGRLVQSIIDPLPSPLALCRASYR